MNYKNMPLRQSYSGDIFVKVTFPSTVFMNNGQHKILNLMVIICWISEILIFGSMGSSPKYLRVKFFGICRSHMNTSLCKRLLFQMTQHHSKSEQLEWELWRTLENSPHLILSTISHKKWHKDEFEAYQHTCHFSDKTCPLHYHRHIKSGLKCF